MPMHANLGGAKVEYVMLKVDLKYRGVVYRVRIFGRVWIRGHKGTTFVRVHYFAMGCTGIAHPDCYLFCLSVAYDN